MKPDFIIGGAPKCATTALFDYLAQHPQVFASAPKEPHYFASEALGRPFMQRRYSMSEYRALFAGCAPGQVAGEGSTHYLQHAAVVAPLIAAHAPEAKLIFCLREPVERAYSHFLFRYSEAGPYDLGGMGQRLGFAAFARDPEMFEAGNYAANLAIFLRWFPASQIHLVFFDDIRTDLAGCLGGICRFLRVDESFAFDLSRRSNTTAYPRGEALVMAGDRLAGALYPRLPLGQRRRLMRLRKRLLFSPRAAKPPLDPADRAVVAGLYRDSVRQLEDLAQRDLTAWRGDEG
jgi:hypothetical protein